MEQKSAMLRQIESIPDLMDELLPAADQAVRGVLSQEEIISLKKIILTGCGDSYCAAGVAAYLLRTLTDLEAEVRSSIDISRHMSMDRLVGPDHSIALIGISASGNVSRVAECMKRVHDRGGFCIAVSGKETSPVAENASRTLKVTVPPFDFAPGVRSYCANILTLTLLAMRIGEVTGKLDAATADGFRRELWALPEKLRGAMPAMLAAAEDLSHKLLDMQMFEFVASGSGFYTSLFNSAKIVEAIGAFTFVNNTEDWFHTTYFFKDLAHTSTCLIANRSSTAADRDLELLEEGAVMGRHIWAITDRDDLTGVDAIVTPAVAHEFLQPLVQYLPAAAVASYLCDAKQELYLRGGKDNWSNCADCALIAGRPLTII